MRFNGGQKSREFMNHIRQYNCLFNFTSLGAKIDNSINDGHGPYVFRISGQLSQKMGTLKPANGQNPKFAQLYIYDTDNEIDHRIKALCADGDVDGHLDRDIVKKLQDMLDDVNPLVKTFRTARDRLKENPDERIAIRILSPQTDGDIQYNLPTCNELALLIVGDFTTETFKRDIIVHDKDHGLTYVSNLHPALMSLQYPLLFPHGDVGFHLGMQYTDAHELSTKTRKTITMLDYYAYCCHYRPGQYNPYLCCGRATSQIQVDSFACLEENRLWFIVRKQKELRSENFQTISDAVGEGCIDGEKIGRKTVLPGSFTGGMRYYVQHYQDAMAICRVHGGPDLFITFTCNSKWPEIAEALRFEPGQCPADRPDVVNRVYKMKQDQLIADIKKGKVFGPVVAGIFLFPTVCRTIKYVSS